MFVSTIDTDQPSVLLGGLTPSTFMRQYWQKKPLLVRGALSGKDLQKIPSAQALTDMACTNACPTRLIQRGTQGWSLKHGPFKKLPSTKTPNWTVLVQGVDLVDAATHDLLNRFRFIPDARLDDAMFSFATKGGGVGPHFDSYDVFLIQTSGARQWQISDQPHLDLVEGAPLKILKRFKPTQEFVLQAGDMLYLPPRYAHDGVALAAADADDKSACVTCSIGFRAPKKQELAKAIVDKICDKLMDEIDFLPEGDDLYSDPKQPAVSDAAQIPTALARFADSVIKPLLNPSTLREMRQEALGEYLSEPKPDVGFEALPVPAWSRIKALHLNAGTKMLFDSERLFINGESFLASGKDLQLMQQLALDKGLTSAQLKGCSKAAQGLLTQWLEDGWCYAK